MPNIGLDTHDIDEGVCLITRAASTANPDLQALGIDRPCPTFFIEASPEREDDDRELYWAVAQDRLSCQRIILGPSLLDYIPEVFADTLASLGKGPPRSLAEKTLKEWIYRIVEQSLGEDANRLDRRGISYMLASGATRTGSLLKVIRSAAKELDSMNLVDIGAAAGFISWVLTNMESRVRRAKLIDPLSKHVVNCRELWSNIHDLDPSISVNIIQSTAKECLFDPDDNFFLFAHVMVKIGEEESIALIKHIAATRARRTLLVFNELFLREGGKTLLEQQSLPWPRFISEIQEIGLVEVFHRTTNWSKPQPAESFNSVTLASDSFVVLYCGG